MLSNPRLMLNHLYLQLRISTERRNVDERFTAYASEERTFGYQLCLRGECTKLKRMFNCVLKFCYIRTPRKALHH